MVGAPLHLGLARPETAGTKAPAKSPIAELLHMGFFAQDIAALLQVVCKHTSFVISIL